MSPVSVRPRLTIWMFESTTSSSEPSVTGALDSGAGAASADPNASGGSGRFSVAPSMWRDAASMRRDSSARKSVPTSIALTLIAPSLPIATPFNCTVTRG